MNLSSFPVVRGIKGDLGRLDMEGFLKALQQVANDVTLFPARIDRAWVEITQKDQIDVKKFDVSELLKVMDYANDDTKILLIKIYSEEREPNTQLERNPRYWVEATFNFQDQTANLRFATVGAENHETIWNLLQPHLQLISHRIPKHHSYLTNFLSRFQRDHGDPGKNVFLIMRFKNEPPFPEIVASIEDACAKRGLKVLRADQKEYSPDLWDNVLIYLYGCGGAIAIFDQINYREFNPNVALEAGFVLATGKPLLVLKDQAIPTMPSDLSGRLYRDFNTYQASATISPQIEKWLNDNVELFA